jgi:hypothetical protein
MRAIAVVAVSFNKSTPFNIVLITYFVVAEMLNQVPKFS